MERINEDFPDLRLLEDLDFNAYMSQVDDGCYLPQLETRRNGGHQLPESPPDSGSENPYSPSDPQPQTIPVPPVLADYRLVNHIPHEMIPQNGDYIYEELKGDSIENNLNEVVVLSQEGIEGMRQVRHDIIDPMYQGRYGMRVDMPELDGMGPQLVALEEPLPVYPVQETSGKKRKLDNSQVKCEPAALSPESTVHVARAPPSVDGSEAGDDAPLQCIRFAPFQQTAWHMLYDGNLKPLQTPSYVVGADKGFNFSQIDEAFVCQKKNHFQVTCQIQVQGDPHYVKTTDGFKKINNFCLHFYGVKAEDPTQEVRVEQSQSDRTKKPFHPVPVEIRREGAKVTVGRLHFAETTNNNMRKKGRPNPDQRHFQLVVTLKAHCPQADHMVVAHASDRIIVRASNPGQFESDCTESWWQRGVSDNSVHFNGKVGINTDRPDEACVVNGNLKVMGHILHPSDARAKHDIVELDTAQQLRNVQSMRVVMYSYDARFAAHSGLLGYDPRGSAPARDTGVLAQELRSILPDAVKEAGDVTLPNGNTIPKFLVVNKDRIFMENLGAVKELCKVTGNLESRIDQLEKINKKLCKISVQRRDSSRSSGSNDSRYSGISNSSKSLYNDQIRDIARSIRRHEFCHKMNHNSPKYTRKQCKNCHGNDSKYGKYNYNKTCERFYTKKPENLDNPNYIHAKLPDFSLKKDTCLPLGSDEDFLYGNTKMRFCCRKDYGDASSELISNKFLQIVITILVFIMAVCLVVMSVLYFREHQQLIIMKESRLHDNLPNYQHYERNRPPPDHNHIHTSKLSPEGKKSVKEKGPHKTTQEFTTNAPTESLHTIATTHQARNYANSINMVESTVPQAEKPITRVSKIIGGRCIYAPNYNNKLETDCQNSCGLDPPHTYDNQEPLEGSKPDKETNDTSIRPLEPPYKDKSPIIPPEKNNSESLHSKNIEEIAENNSLDSNKQNVSEVRQRREAQEIRSSEEMTLNEQSREIGHDLLSDCDTVYFGIASKSQSNSIWIFSEDVCPQTMYRFNYTVPVSNCLKDRNMEIMFRSSRLKEFRLCDVHCNGETSRSCQDSRELPKLTPDGNLWRFRIGLECNEAKNVMLRARFTPIKRKDLCSPVQEILTYVEYNIRIYSDCPK